MTYLYVLRNPITTAVLNIFFRIKISCDFHFSPINTVSDDVSPCPQVGEKFRSRALRFPSLVSGCTVDWFQPWPKQALIAVAQHFIDSFSLACEPAVREQLVQAMGAVQDTVADYCIQFFLR